MTPKTGAVALVDLQSPRARQMEHVFSLGALLSEDVLGLSLATGGSEALRRRVSGAHAIEVEHPARWLAPDWVMLTTGVMLRGRPQMQRELIDELERAHVSALGFGVDVVFRRIPPALLAEAERRSFPVFEIPLGTPFREVISAVHRSLVGGEMRIYQRMSSIQRYLVDALTQEDPQRTLLSRLAGLLDATAVLFDLDGTVLASTAAAPHEALWEQIATNQDAFIAEFETGGWLSVAGPVRRANEPAPRWLAVTTRRAGFSVRLAKVAVHAAAALLAAIARLDELAAERERAVRGGLLEDTLAGARADERGPLAIQAASFGLDFREPAQVVVIEPRSSGELTHPAAIATLAGRLEAELTPRRIPHLLSRRSTEVVALVQQRPPELRQTLAGVLAAQPGFVAGIGRPIQELAAAEPSFRDAQLAVTHLRRSPTGEPLVADVTELDLATLLISEVSPERLRSRVRTYLEPLQATRHLYETLTTYFAHDLDVTATARALHIHPNTLRYRLGQVEKLIGQPLRQPSTIAALHIVLSTQSPAEQIGTDANGRRA